MKPTLTRPFHTSLRTIRRLLTAVLLLSAAVSHADAPPAAAILSARLVDLRNNNGMVGCALYASAKGFPEDPSAAMQTKWCPIADKEARCSFDPIPAGTYAVACFHDENNNRKLDTGMFGIPTEGVVSSNDAKGVMGPPSFKDARFSFKGAPTELRLRVRY
jgi:uncharacterized protein (DUF2141 family)